ncbi:helix-turn-helix domain-containing protein [Embleya sp. AB8]|uniref:helix-turn-helix domain-containing protein n=1 Tax=Embleya sp. AB8 TaxID=3156304 RepID=UPI003C76D4AA
MAGTVVRSSTPTESSAGFAARALQTVKRSLSRASGAGPIRFGIEGEPEAALELPREAVELLASLLGHMAAGRAVSIVPDHAELTTQQAADMLNVSRPFLVGLLDAGEIEFRKVGTHRRIRAQSLIDHQREDDRKRREAADELTTLGQDAGLT